MPLATRMGRIGESATLAVARKAKELQAAGRDILDLGAGEPDFPSPSVAVEAARAALLAGQTKYTENAGPADLRRALAERYNLRHGTPWGPGEVLVTVGGKAALFELSHALYEEGGEVVIPTPAWVSFAEQARLLGATPVFVPLAAADGFRVHADAVLAKLTDRTSAVLLNVPSNPTGGVVSPEDLRRIVQGCAEREIPLIYDETYERFRYDGGEHASAAALAAEFPDSVVVVGSFSKTYAMTGWRVGYALGPRAVIAAAASVQSHMTSNATTFAMAGALAALQHAETDVQAMIAEYQARRDLLIPRLNALPGFECRPPAGAFYAFPRVADCYRPGRDGSIAFADHLLETAGVAVVPGLAFGDDRHIRLSFACSRQTLEQALDRIAGALGA